MFSLFSVSNLIPSSIKSLVIIFTIPLLNAEEYQTREQGYKVLSSFHNNCDCRQELTAILKNQDLDPESRRALTNIKVEYFTTLNIKQLPRADCFYEYWVRRPYGESIPVMRNMQEIIHNDFTMLHKYWQSAPQEIGHWNNPGWQKLGFQLMLDDLAKEYNRTEIEYFINRVNNYYSRPENKYTDWNYVWPLYSLNER